MFILRLKALKIDTISRLRKKVKTTSISFVLAQHNILPLNLYFVFSICSSQTYFFGTQYVALFWKMYNLLLHNLTVKYVVIVSQFLLKTHPTHPHHTSSIKWADTCFSCAQCCHGVSPRGFRWPATHRMRLCILKTP